MLIAGYMHACWITKCDSKTRDCLPTNTGSTNTYNMCHLGFYFYKISKQIIVSDATTKFLYDNLLYGLI